MTPLRSGRHAQPPNCNSPSRHRPDARSPHSGGTFTRCRRRQQVFFFVRLTLEPAGAATACKAVGSGFDSHRRLLQASRRCATPAAQATSARGLADCVPNMGSNEHIGVVKLSDMSTRYGIWLSRVRIPYHVASTSAVNRWERPVSRTSLHNWPKGGGHMYDRPRFGSLSLASSMPLAVETRQQRDEYGARGSAVAAPTSALQCVDTVMTSRRIPGEQGLGNGKGQRPSPHPNHDSPVPTCKSWLKQHSALHACDRQMFHFPTAWRG